VFQREFLLSTQRSLFRIGFADPKSANEELLSRQQRGQSEASNACLAVITNLRMNPSQPRYLLIVMHFDQPR
jgi:hypothetical protein